MAFKNLLGNSYKALEGIYIKVSARSTVDRDRSEKRTLENSE
jgi:hypothetical protein